jgi:hypothetical protein
VDSVLFTEETNMRPSRWFKLITIKSNFTLNEEIFGSDGTGNVGSQPLEIPDTYLVQFVNHNSDRKELMA